jgi:hypothetical protein
MLIIPTACLAVLRGHHLILHVLLSRGRIRSETDRALHHHRLSGKVLLKMVRKDPWRQVQRLLMGLVGEFPPLGGRCSVLFMAVALKL